MNLDLDLELKTNEVVVGQSIPMLLTLINNNKKSQKLPFLIDSGTVTNFILYNEKEEKINEFNGLTIALNEGLPPDMTVSLLDLGAGESWSWDNDLLAYARSLNTGKYFLQAAYRYDKMDIDLTTEMKELIIHPNFPSYLDLVQDQVMVGMIYTLLIHKIADSGDEEIIFNMGYNTKPGSFLYGCTLDFGSGILPYISKVDFINAMDFDHDTYRWLSWEKDNSIYLASVFRDKLKVEPKKVGKDIKKGILIRRPIQHLDKGVSLFILAEQSKNKHGIIRIDFDEEAEELSREEIITLDYKPEPINVSATYTGEYHVTWGDNGHTPIHWLKIDPKLKDKGKAKAKVKPMKIFPIEDENSKADPNAPIPEIMFLEPSLPIGETMNHSILLLSNYVEKDKSDKKKEKEIGLKVESFKIMIEADDRDVLPGTSIFIEGDVKKIAPINGHLIQNRDMSLMGIIGTADGVVHYLPPSGEVSKLMNIEPDLGLYLKLVMGGKGSIELFFLKPETGINIYPLVGRQL